MYSRNRRVWDKEPAPNDTISLAEREIDGRRLVVLDGNHCERDEWVLVYAGGQFVKARVLDGGPWPIAVCYDGAGS